MPDGSQRSGVVMLLNPVNQNLNCGRVVGGGHRLAGTMGVRAIHADGAVRRSDPLNLTIQNTVQRLGAREHCKFDTRRSTVECQNKRIV